ncbi:hypothetical protein COCVIDRAFT_88884 [Bipolaris victoriae FI3]|uniref:Uncharacterized protein n=1 Tax=Bipolaris victoriae (strain FI3) TaxID=930091 RepID=W7EW16_BIPV3|nr:hypothetical protein COCVIDRAFT_88884 [Bipolaris victoriae FI3]
MDATGNNTNNLEYLVYDKDATIVNPSTATRPTPIQPITTIVPVLDRTAYNEAEETEGSERTLDYVRVQLKTLQYLASLPADMLNGQQACEWTQMISPTNFKPTAQEALRLCYYLRSQGFDTFATFKRGYMRLYVANQESYTRNPRVDVLYWKQDVTTNDVSYQCSPRTPGLVVGGRRNAAPMIPLHSAEGQALYDYYHQQQRQDQRTLDSLATLASAAEIRLQNLVADENPDLGEIEVTLMQLEEYRARLRGD